MKTLKSLLMLLLLISFMACKKNDAEPKTFDITKYSIIGKLSIGYPYVISLDADKATMTHYSVNEGKYSYADGSLKLNFNNGEVVCTFEIENGKVKSYQGSPLINTYDLVEIPATNQFMGKTFKGSWSNSAQSTEFKFIANQFTETTNNRQSVVNYTLINNLALKKVDGTNLTLLVIINEKLEGGRYLSPSTFWGSFMKQ